MKLYTYLAMAGVLTLSFSAGAQVPTYGFGEVVTQTVDQMRSEKTKDLIQTQKNLVNSTLSALKTGAGSVGKEMQEALTGSSVVITGKYEGLQNLLGEDSEYGEIKIKSCGGNVDEVVARLNETIVYPAKAGGSDGRESWSESRKDKRNSDLAYSQEMASITALAKAWTAQKDASQVSNLLSKTQEELNNDVSQLAVIATILRLQEETQKNVNMRVSIMGDELISAGLSALDTGV